MKANAYLYEDHEQPMATSNAIGLGAIRDIDGTPENPVVIWVGYGNRYWRGSKKAPTYFCWREGCYLKDDDEMMECYTASCTAKVHMRCLQSTSSGLVWCEGCNLVYETEELSDTEMLGGKESPTKEPPSGTKVQTSHECTLIQFCSTHANRSRFTPCFTLWCADDGSAGPQNQTPEDHEQSSSDLAAGGKLPVCQRLQRAALQTARTFVLICVFGLCCSLMLTWLVTLSFCPNSRSCSRTLS